MAFYLFVGGVQALASGTVAGLMYVTLYGCLQHLPQELY